MLRRTKIRHAHAASIDRAAQRFRDHEGISPALVLDWLTRFDDADIDLAIKVIDGIKYYSASDIRRMVGTLVTQIRRHLRKTRPDRIYYVPVGHQGGGASIIARALIQSPGVAREQVKHMLEIERMPKTDIGAIVFVDDFSGSGDTLTDWWTNVEMMIRPIGVPIIVGLLVLNHLARPKIEKFASSLLPVEELQEESNVLSAQCVDFQQPEKDTILEYCRETGCGPIFERGYAACGLLVAFRHLCPNNSLPILWYDSKSWGRLFNRRAI
jgi:hypothetical protein